MLRSLATKGVLGLGRRLTGLPLESGGVSIIIACADSSGRTEGGVSILTGIFDSLEVTGVRGSCLDAFTVDCSSDSVDKW